MESAEKKKVIIEKLNQSYIELCHKFCIIKNLAVITLLIVFGCLWIGLLFDMKVYMAFVLLVSLLIMVSTEVFKTYIHSKYSRTINSILTNAEQKQCGLIVTTSIEKFNQLLSENDAISILVVLCIMSMATIRLWTTHVNVVILNIIAVTVKCKAK